MRTSYAPAMSTRSVLICGGGIAGPALAFWLARQGLAVTIVERAPAPRPGGQAVDLRGAGRTVVERMGLLDAVRAISLDQRGIAWVRDDGRIAARMPVDAFGGEGIVSEIEVLRGDLSAVLYEATLPETEYLFDDTVTALEQDDSGVRVTFLRAAPRRFDLVVGADGSHSVIRALAIASETECTEPVGCYVSWFTAPAEVDLDGWFLMHNAPGGLVASVRPGRLAGEHKVGLSFRSAPLALDRADVAAQKALVAERFAGAGWEVPRLIAAMEAAPDFVLDSMAQVRLPTWSRGRVVLIGDAAWSPTPLTGLGTTLALVGAYVLAGELAVADGDQAVAFRRLEEVLRAYVQTSQQLPPGGVGSYAPISPARIRLGLAMMWWMTRWPVRRLIAGQFAKAGRIDLPEYDVVLPRGTRFM
jgi:2-polyprenyl-6-methoxyphenol hydroxylase-like FAD-dependent oxidoreductase